MRKQYYKSDKKGFIYEVEDDYMRIICSDGTQHGHNGVDAGLRAGLKAHCQKITKAQFENYLRAYVG